MKHLDKFALVGVAMLSISSCSDDEAVNTSGPDYQYVGQAVGNFTEAEWYPGGKEGTTDNTGSASYQDETPAVTASGLTSHFNHGELFFEHNYVENLNPTTEFKGLGPAWCALPAYSAIRATVTASAWSNIVPMTPTATAIFSLFTIQRQEQMETEKRMPPTAT